MRPAHKSMNFPLLFTARNRPLAQDGSKISHGIPLPNDCQPLDTPSTALDHPHDAMKRGTVPRAKCFVCDFGRLQCPRR